MIMDDDYLPFEYIRDKKVDDIIRRIPDVESLCGESPNKILVKDRSNGCKEDWNHFSNLEVLYKLYRIFNV